MKMALCGALFHLGTLIATMVIKDKLMIVEPGHDNGHLGTDGIILHH